MADKREKEKSARYGWGKFGNVANWDPSNWQSRVELTANFTDTDRRWNSEGQPPRSQSGTGLHWLDVKKDEDSPSAVPEPRAIPDWLKGFGPSDDDDDDRRVTQKTSSARSSASGRNVALDRREVYKVSDETAAAIKAALDISSHFKREQATPRPVHKQTFVQDVREPREQLALSDTVYAPVVESAADTSLEEEPDFTAEEAADTREVET